MVNKYYQKNKEKLRKQARERYPNLSEEEKEKRRKTSRDRYKNLSEEEKEKNVNIIVIQLRIFLKKRNKKSWLYEKLLFST